MTVPILAMRGMTKRFGSLLAADGIDLTLHAGEVLALLGENGAGKTTLMNMLFGEYMPDAGEIRVTDESGRDAPLPPGQPQAALRARIGMVHQHFALAENLSVLDNILLGAEPLHRPWRNRRPARRKLETLMQASGLRISPDAQLRELSVGERQRVEILKALYRDARILVLDEPTAVLTPAEADRLFASLRELVAGGLAVIFISHKLREVLAFSDRFMVLRHGRKVAEMPARSANADDIVRMMVGEAAAPVEHVPGNPGRTVLSLHGVSVPQTRSDPPLRNASIELRGGEIAGVAGVSGNGQTTLAKVISGLARPTEGEIEVRGTPVGRLTPKDARRFGIGRIPEDRHQDGLVPDMSVADNLLLEAHGSPRFQRWGLLRRRDVRAHARKMIRDHDIRCRGPDSRAALMSGGNIQKLILARVLADRPAVILANQPTRGLDVRAAGELMRRLVAARDRGAAVLLISEDLDEVLSVADRLFAMHDGRLTESPTRDRTRIGALMAGRAAEGRKPAVAAPATT